MSFVAVGGAVIGVAGTMVEANQQKQAAKGAANAQEAAANKNSALTGQVNSNVFNVTQAQNQPNRTLGGLASQREAFLLGLDPNLDISGATSQAHMNPDGSINWTGSGALKAGSQANGGISSSEYQSMNPNPGQGWSGDRTHTMSASSNPSAPGSSGGEGFGSFSTPYNASTFSIDPGYKFRLEQGQDAIARTNAASGHGYSGKALEGALQYSSGLASQEFQNAYTRSMNTQKTQFDELNALQNDGQLATNGTTGALSTAGSNIVNGMTNANNAIGNAQSAEASTEGNIWANTINGVGNAVNTGMNTWAKKTPAVIPPANTNEGFSGGAAGLTSPAYTNFNQPLTLMPVS